MTGAKKNRRPLVDGSCLPLSPAARLANKLGSRGFFSGRSSSFFAFSGRSSSFFAFSSRSSGGVSSGGFFSNRSFRSGDFSSDFGSRGFDSGGFGSFLLGAGGQSQAQGQGDQQLVDAHESNP